jgi:hypothetical protein
LEEDSWRRSSLYTDRHAQSGAGIWTFDHVLKKKIRILGEDHPDTLLSMRSLAHAFRELGKLEEAAKMDEQMLETDSDLSVV